jgi:hypothetical protein
MLLILVFCQKPLKAVYNRLKRHLDVYVGDASKNAKMIRKFKQN